MSLGSSARTVVSARNRGAGVLVAGRYRLERTIGSGGMGTIWLAHDQSLDVKCALKLIDEDQAANTEIRLRFEREAKASAKLRSTHVVDVFDFGEWDGMCFMAMEYLQGEDLSSRLERVGRLDCQTTYRIVAHVARALMHAHAQGIVHRDLKPENIFLVRGYDEEIAKVLDFGIARTSDAYQLDDNATREGAFLGTPCYVSPEQARGRPIDYRSDLWSLGVIAFECLTGHLPFNGEALGDLMARILYEPIPRPTSFNPELPLGIDAWWERAAERDRERRFQSAKEMADQLGDALAVAALVGVPTGRSRSRGSYPSVNDQSGVILSQASRREGGTPNPQMAPPSAMPSALTRTPRLRTPVALSAVALLLSIGAILGVWFRGNSADANPIRHASIIAHDDAHTNAAPTPPPSQSIVAPIPVESIPVVPSVPSGKDNEATTGANSANPPALQKGAPVPHRAPFKRESTRDYGI